MNTKKVRFVKREDVYNDSNVILTFTLYTFLKLCNYEPSMKATYCSSNIRMYLCKHLHQLIIDLPQESYYKQGSDVVSCDFLLKFV